MDKRFEVVVEWTQTKTLILEAANRDQAIAMARNANLPESGDYVDGTFDVTHCSQPDCELSNELEDDEV
ncbi:MAG: hypothetical protein PHV62_05890 [Sulfuricurvum sp.]|nr:hypothetical protein [Sulfuricurvum sp.]